jgi:hypothetical protein
MKDMQWIIGAVGVGAIFIILFFTKQRSITCLINSLNKIQKEDLKECLIESLKKCPIESLIKSPINTLVTKTAIIAVTVIAVAVIAGVVIADMNTKKSSDIKTTAVITVKPNARLSRVSTKDSITIEFNTVR